MDLSPEAQGRVEGSWGAQRLPRLLCDICKFHALSDPSLTHRKKENNKGSLKALPGL